MNDESTATPCASATSHEEPQPRLSRKRGGYRPRRAPHGRLMGEELRMLGPDPVTESSETFRCVVSEDGNWVVLLRRIDYPTGPRLYVERVHRTTPAEIITYLMLFEHEDEFLDWCDTDPIRFQINVTHQVRRIGHELLDITH